MFGADQLTVLADQLQALVMLRYNDTGDRRSGAPAFSPLLNVGTHRLSLVDPAPCWTWSSCFLSISILSPIIRYTVFNFIERKQSHGLKKV